MVTKEQTGKLLFCYRPKAESSHPESVDEHISTDLAYHRLTY